MVSKVELNLVVQKIGTSLLVKIILNDRKQRLLIQQAMQSVRHGKSTPFEAKSSYSVTDPDLELRRGVNAGPSPRSATATAVLSSGAEP